MNKMPLTLMSIFYFFTLLIPNLFGQTIYKFDFPIVEKAEVIKSTQNKLFGRYRYFDHRSNKYHFYVMGSSQIAHAGGAITGIPNTYAVRSNSLEALDDNYKIGQRVFEMDFQWSADNYLIALHDWDKTFDLHFPNLSHPIIFFDFFGLNRNFITLLGIDQILKWFALHPDTYLVTDIKKDNVRALTAIFTKLQAVNISPNRIIPQVYQFQQFQQVKSLGYENIILTLYEMSPGKKLIPALEEFLDKTPPYAVTVPRWSKFLDVRSFLTKKLHRKAILLYVHTIVTDQEFEQYLNEGFDGIYTDRKLKKPL